MGTGIRTKKVWVGNRYRCPFPVWDVHSWKEKRWAEGCVAYKVIQLTTRLERCVSFKRYP